MLFEAKADILWQGVISLIFFKLLDHSDEVKRQKFKELITKVHVLVKSLANLPVPVIASVRGAAAGFGISVVAGCDFAIASENSFFTSAYNLLGTSPDGGSTYYLTRTVGLKKAMEIALTTKRYDANSALQMGLVNKVVEDSELESETAVLCKQICGSAKRAVANTKHLIRQSYQNDLSTQLDLETIRFLECVVTKDFEEGVRAFVDKRKPQFKE